MKYLHKTRSFCDICSMEVSAYTFEKRGKIFIKKKCPVHGKFQEEHMWDDPDIYRSFMKLKTVQAPPAHLAIVLTYKCNLNCSVCFANANEVAVRDFEMEDLEKTKDYKLVFLTGGEPTVLENLPQIIETMKANGQKPVVLSNGIKLTNIDYLQKLKKAGLRYVRLQFDTLKSEDIKYFRGKNLLKTKLRAIRNMEKIGLPISLCVVVIKRNIKDLKSLFRFILKHPTIKVVSLNPMRRAGRFDENDFVSASMIIREVSEILDIKKKYWIETTRFLINLDKLLSFRKPGKRKLFCRCNLKCQVLPFKGKGIPLGKIFNLKKINLKIEEICLRRSRIKLYFFYGYFIFREVMINFLVNKYFRLLIFRIIKNLPYLIKKEFMLFNPFYSFHISVYPVKRNLDLDFVKDCNFHSISSQDMSFSPACIQRMDEVTED